MGISRSSSITIATMMWLKKWTLAESLYYVAGRRPYVRPNTGFMNQLGQWEMKLYGVYEPSISSNKLSEVIFSSKLELIVEGSRTFSQFLENSIQYKGARCRTYSKVSFRAVVR
jgi:hypothetical protein